MFAQVLLAGRKTWKVLKISFWVLGCILVLGTAILMWGYGRALLPDLRPCTKTAMGRPAEGRDSRCAGWWSFASAPTSSSCSER
jgi:hypothetical protein